MVVRIFLMMALGLMIVFSTSCTKDIPFDNFYGKWKLDWPTFEKEFKESKSYKVAGQLGPQTLLKMKPVFENLQIQVTADTVSGLDNLNNASAKDATRTYKKIEKKPKDVELKKSEYLIQYEDKKTDYGIDVEIDPELVIISFSDNNKMRMSTLGEGNEVIFWLIFDRL